MGGRAVPGVLHHGPRVLQLCAARQAEPAARHPAHAGREQGRHGASETGISVLRKGDCISVVL